MENIESVFNDKATLIKTLEKKPNNEELLKLYGLYKQSTEGDCNTKKPTGIFDFKGKAKWDSWNKNKGKEKINSMIDYIKFVDVLMVKY
jgi:diazepam-binding inhibitor (GABA receptor modulating acyl-CoA-binding protein)